MKTTIPSWAAAQPIPAPGFLDTGSLPLNRLLERERVGTGRVLHLCGGGATLQELVLLALCRAATQRNRDSVFLDTEKTLSPQAIEEAGLGRHFDAQNPSRARSRFRVLSPQTPSDVDAALMELAREQTSPAIVVVTGVHAALRNRFCAGNQSQKSIEQAGRTLWALIIKTSLLCEKSGMTAVLAHSPQDDSNTPTLLERTIRGTLFKHCGFGLEIGQAWQVKRGDDFFRVPMQAWRYNTPSGEEAVLKIGQNGQFKNP